MRYKIIFSENAKQDLTSIVRYISDELMEPYVAKKLAQKILTAIKSLDELPMRHCLYDYEKWKSLGLRVLPIENYLVFYVPDEINRVVRIYRIIYKKRNLKNQLKENIIFK